MSTLRIDNLKLRIENGDYTPEEKAAMLSVILREEQHEDALATQNKHRSHDEIVEAIEKTDLPEVTNTITTSEG